MDKTRDSTNSKIWPDSTCAISVRRNGQILLVVESLVLSTTDSFIRLSFLSAIFAWTCMTRLAAARLWICCFQKTLEVVMNGSWVVFVSEVL